MSGQTTCARGGRRRLWPLALTGAVAAALLPVAAVYACIGVVGLSTSPTSVQPGGSVTVNGKDFAPEVPIELHLDSLSAPVFFTIPAFKGDSMTSTFSVTVPIPSTVSTGRHVIIASQTERDMNSGNPARAVLYVGTPAANQPAVSSRPATASVDNGPGIGGLALIALAAAAFGLFVFALIGVMAGRRPGAAARV
ncbi:MAG: hypothetical protein JOZ75_11410 [Candidatus Dormibacteraeota bacterium]|nr:hypothetical protein [Candidatus Dormibacteraeota bacterium]